MASAAANWSPVAEAPLAITGTFKVRTYRLIIEARSTKKVAIWFDSKFNKILRSQPYLRILIMQSLNTTGLRTGTLNIHSVLIIICMRPLLPRVPRCPPENGLNLSLIIMRIIITNRSNDVEQLHLLVDRQRWRLRSLKDFTSVNFINFVIIMVGIIYSILQKVRQ